jgi:hypothetical protein
MQTFYALAAARPSTGSLRDPVRSSVGGGEQALHEQHVASETGSTAV